MCVCVCVQELALFQYSSSSDGKEEEEEAEEEEEEEGEEEEGEEAPSNGVSAKGVRGKERSLIREVTPVMPNGSDSRGCQGEWVCPLTTWQHHWKDSCTKCLGKVVTLSGSG